MATLRDFRTASAEVRRSALRRVAQMLFFDSLIAAILFVSAGILRWTYGWVFTAAMVLVQLAGAFLMPLEVVAERGRKKENTERWDTLMASLLVPAFFSIYLVSGLDHRWHWSAGIADVWHIAALLFFLLGCALEMWAMASNRFFSTAVRIQYERGHEVCASGPYRYVRHPGYLGMIVYYGVTPILLGSFWALLPALAMALLLIVRTVLEDRTLQQKLPGYSEYAARVRWRILPGVW